MPFYNTIGADGQLLIGYEQKTGGQKDTLYSFFQSHPTGVFTTVELHKKLKKVIPCHCSLKRACSDLKNANKLKFYGKVKGPWGKDCHKYGLA